MIHLIIEKKTVEKKMPVAISQSPRCKNPKNNSIKMTWQLFSAHEKLNRTVTGLI